ncbi:MAG: hypothetical protein Q8O88_03480 [bacterium]|nr:hypothetical protein [bacterium]
MYNEAVMFGRIREVCEHMVGIGNIPEHMISMVMEEINNGRILPLSKTKTKEVNIPHIEEVDEQTQAWFQYCETQVVEGEKELKMLENTRENSWILL